MLTHGVDAPGYAAHALRLATAAVALGDRVVVYLAVAGAAWLGDEVPAGWSGSLAEARQAGVSLCVCPTSLAELGLSLAIPQAHLCGAVAAVELARRARTVISL